MIGPDQQCAVLTDAAALRFVRNGRHIEEDARRISMARGPRPSASAGAGEQQVAAVTDEVERRDPGEPQVRQPSPGLAAPATRLVSDREVGVLVRQGVAVADGHGRLAEPRAVPRPVAGAEHRLVHGQLASARTSARCSG